MTPPVAPQAERHPGGLTVLLVGTDAAVATRFEAALADAEEGSRLRLMVQDLASARASLRRAAADVVLLPLPQSGQRGAVPLVELRAAAPEVPVVVIADAEHEPLAIKAVQLGAADYLLAERLYGTLVARCLLHAVQSSRVRAELERHEALATPFAASDGGPGSQAATLRVALPHAFEELVDEYRQILDQAVDQLVHRVDEGVEARVRGLARRAAELRAGARDVVDIHATAMKAKKQEQGPQRLKLYVAEGRVRVLELMGYLATYYRDLGMYAQRRALR
jgi:DNA-binding NarL/FixJ family response regulator